MLIPDGWGLWTPHLGVRSVVVPNDYPPEEGPAPFGSLTTG